MHDHFDLPGWGVYMHKLVDVLESKVLGLQRNSSQVYFYFLLSICLGRHPAEILHLARVHRFSFPTSLTCALWMAKLAKRFPRKCQETFFWSRGVNSPKDSSGKHLQWELFMQSIVVHGPEKGNRL